MLIIDKDSKPKDTVLYASASLAHLLKASPLAVPELYVRYQQLQISNASYDTFLAALNFLYLLDLIKIGEDGRIYEVK